MATRRQRLEDSQTYNTIHTRPHTSNTLDPLPPSPPAARATSQKTNEHSATANRPQRKKPRSSMTIDTQIKRKPNHTRLHTHTCFLHKFCYFHTTIQIPYDMNFAKRENTIYTCAGVGRGGRAGRARRQARARQRKNAVTQPASQPASYSQQARQTDSPRSS